MAPSRSIRASLKMKTSSEQISGEAFYALCDNVRGLLPHSVADSLRCRNKWMKNMRDYLLSVQNRRTFVIEIKIHA